MRSTCLRYATIINMSVDCRRKMCVFIPFPYTSHHFQISLVLSLSFSFSFRAFWGVGISLRILRYQYLVIFFVKNSKELSKVQRTRNKHLLTRAKFTRGIVFVFFYGSFLTQFNVWFGLLRKQINGITTIYCLSSFLWRVTLGIVKLRSFDYDFDHKGIVNIMPIKLPGLKWYLSGRVLRVQPSWDAVFARLN